MVDMIFGLVFCLTSRSTIFQSFWDGATTSWVFISTLGTLKCLAQGHYMVVRGSNPGPLAPEFEALPLSHRGPHGGYEIHVQSLIHRLANERYWCGKVVSLLVMQSGSRRWDPSLPLSFG